MKIKRLIAAVLLAASLAVVPVAAQSGSSFYDGYYSMPGFWGYIGWYCYWQYQIYADGGGWYYNSCGGGVAWF
jgi:hypothetical protein